MKSVFLFLLTFVSLTAQASSPVWLVESGHNRLYLTGTIHVLRNSDYPLPEAINTAYNNSKILVFETDIAGSSSPAFQSQLIQAVSLKQNQSLQNFLSTQTLAKLEAHLAANQLSIKQFSHFNAAMVSITLTMIELKKLGVGSDGVDQYYFNKALQDNKKTLALESLQQQINFLAAMGKGQEDQMILQTLEDISNLASQFTSMVKNWRSGNTQQLEALFIQPMRQDFESLYQQLLVQRNLNWIAHIEHYLKTAETEMVLVGTAHLLGKDGLINYLQQAGYKVTQME